MAVQSWFPGVGSLVPYGEAEVGAVAHTGAALYGWDGWAGCSAGRHCVALGNGLASSDVVHRMVTTFEDSRASLAERLMAALESGRRGGGDTWDSAARQRCEPFLGSENYDNRIDDGSMLDLEVLADLRRRYGRRAV